MKAVLSGFEIACVSRVDVDKMNRFVPVNISQNRHAPAVLRIIGDHVEGLEQLIALTNSRGGFTMEIEKEMFYSDVIKKVYDVCTLFCLL